MMIEIHNIYIYIYTHSAGDTNGSFWCPGFG